MLFGVYLCNFLSMQIIVLNNFCGAGQRPGKEGWDASIVSAFFFFAYGFFSWNIHVHHGIVLSVGLQILLNF
jgi:hypothetical protein